MPAILLPDRLASSVINSPVIFEQIGHGRLDQLQAVYSQGRLDLRQPVGQTGEQK